MITATGGRSLAVVCVVLWMCECLWPGQSAVVCGQDAVPAAGGLLSITVPPAELKIPDYYSQYVSAGGYPIVASARVNPYALREAAAIVDLLLSRRPDVREAMIRGGSRLCIIAHSEYTTDLPEWRWMGDRLRTVVRRRV
jgi:hypothetical protein